jgi:hypothetical protein
VRGTNFKFFLCLRDSAVKFSQLISSPTRFGVSKCYGSPDNCKPLLPLPQFLSAMLLCPKVRYQELAPSRVEATWLHCTCLRVIPAKTNDFIRYGTLRASILVVLFTMPPDLALGTVFFTGTFLFLYNKRKSGLHSLLLGLGL